MAEAPIEVAPYDARWPAAFEQERALLAEALPGRNVACALVYVGGPRLIAVSGAMLDRVAPHLAVTPP